jgi:chromate reductase
MDPGPVRVLAISGSLRKGSYNTALMRAAIEIAGAEGLPLSFTEADIRAIPPYDEDVRAVGLPASVAALREAVAAADALLIVTPEYNYSIPGVLKNAIDWASRPPDQPFAGKPFAVMGASSGMGGTTRAQYHLRQVAVYVDMLPVNKPEVFVRNAKNVFDDQGRLTDEATRAVVHRLLVALVAWTRRVGRQV